MNYTIVEAYTSDQLVTKVNQMLVEGWNLLGTLKVSPGSNRTLYTQAMTKE